MAGSILGVGVTGLQAAQLGLDTTSHNIANVNTPGFNRQQIVQGTQIPLLTGSGFVGQGTSVETIRRQFDQFLTRQVVQGESQGASLNAFNGQIQQINNLLADASSGLAPAMQEFFDSLGNLSNDPGSASTRQTVLGAAQGLVGRFQLLDQRVQELRTGIDGQITGIVSEINSFAQEIAQLNDRIGLVESTGQQPANDLRDQRDQLVLQLNQRIGATVVQQGSAYNVFIGSGVPLVLGNQVTGLGTLSSPTDPGRTAVGVVTPGATNPIQESSLQGGSLGGLLSFRAQSLDATGNALGRIALVLGDAINSQHALGQDLTGAPGGNLFNLAAPVVGTDTGNTGNGQLGAVITNYGALTASDYSVLYDGVNWVVTRLSDGVQQTLGALPASVDGVTLSLAAGAPNAGDSFLVRPTVDGASGISVAISDGSKIAAAAPMRTARGSANTGTATISAGSVNAPPPQDPNITLTVTITFTSATTFDVAGVGTGNPTGVAYLSGANITFNGWTAQISGTPATGDTFTVAANGNGVSDNRNALLLAGLQSQYLVAGGTETLAGSYSVLVNQVGNDTRQSQISTDAQKAFLDQAKQAQQSFSGVNLDEEAANLVRYQQAYQASARTIQVGSQLFQDLLDALK